MSTASAGSSSTRVPRRPRLVEWVLVPLLLVAAALVLVTAHVSAYTQVSPIDEMQHIGYLYDVPDVVVSGEKVGQEALGQVACRGIDAAFPTPGCGDAPYDPEAFPEFGFNTAYVHPPTYYVVTRVGAEVVSTLTPAEDLVTGGRLTGWLWLAGGLLLAYAAGRRLGAGRIALFGPLLLVAATPAILMSSATVNPDAASFAVGAFCLLMVILWTQKTGRARWWLLVAAGIVAEVIKLQNLVVLLALALFLLVPVVLDRRAGEWRAVLRTRLLAVAVLAAPALAVAISWTLAVRLRAVVPPDEIPMNTRFLVDSLTLSNFTVHIGSFLTPLDTPYTPPPLASGLIASLAVLTSVLVVSGVVASALFGGERSTTTVQATRSLGLAVVVVGLAGAPFLVALNFGAQGQFIAIPYRYALTLVPLMVVLLAVQLRERWSAVAVTVFGVLAVIGTVVELTLLGT